MEEYLHHEQRNGYTLIVDYEQFADDPQNWGYFKMHVWNGRFDRGLVTGETQEYFQTEGGKYTPATQAKLRAGILWPVQVRSYSNSDGGFYSLAGTDQDTDGFIELTDAKNMSWQQRKELAESCLKEYQAWANGEVYSAAITEDATGEYIDGSGDCYNLEETISIGQDTLARLAPVHEAAVAKNANQLHK